MSKLKHLLWTALAIGVVGSVAGCGGGTVAPTPTGLVLPTSKAAPATSIASTSVPAATAPAGGISLTPAGVASAPKLDPGGMCKASGSPQPVPNFATSLPTDHVRGEANAPLPLYEYSDFQ